LQSGHIEAATVNAMEEKIYHDPSEGFTSLGSVVEIETPEVRTFDERRS